MPREEVQSRRRKAEETRSASERDVLHRRRRRRRRPPSLSASRKSAASLHRRRSHPLAVGERGLRQTRRPSERERERERESRTTRRRTSTRACRFYREKKSAGEPACARGRGGAGAQRALDPEVGKSVDRSVQPRARHRAWPFWPMAARTTSRRGLYAPIGLEAIAEESLAGRRSSFTPPRFR